MRKICGILLSLVMLLGMGLSVVNAQETESMETESMQPEEEKVYRLADTPSRYGFKGMYALFSPDTAQQGKFGIGVFWEMTRFCLPGDPRYPELQEFMLAGYYGITDRLEVGLSAPFRSLKLPAASDYEVNGVRGRWPTDPALDEVSESGFSNVSLGLRYQVLGDTKEETGLKLTPYIQAFLPTAQDPELGNGAENTRIHFGVSAGAVLPDMMNARLYTQAAYQFATDYDQDREDFTERGWWANPLEPPRFDYFGTNPLFHEYGNTLFYGGGFALPIISNTVELFTEFLLYHSFEDPDYIPMFEDYNEPNNFEELDVVQDGGAVHVGTQIGFGNGLVLTAGWGSKLFAEEPMYESPLWRVFAGLSYNSPAEVVVRVGEVEQPEAPEERPGAEEAVEVPPEEIVGRINCDDILNLMVHFEFDKSTLTPEGIATLQQVGKLLRYCTGYTVEVQGHTDWEGTENYNIGLGNRRARAVVYYLVYDEGIDPNRVVLKEKMDRTPPVIAGETYGETQPIASNETDSGRALNRRGQFVKR